MLCLKKLISKTDFYSSNTKYIKNIFEKIILFIDNLNFELKSNLLDVLNFLLETVKNYINLI